MFSLKRREEPISVIDPVIEELISAMAGYEPNSEEYTAMAANLKVLLEAKAVEPKPEKLSPNTIAVVAGNLAGILLILGFEKANVVTSKALNLLLKPRA